MKLLKEFLRSFIETTLDELSFSKPKFQIALGVVSGIVSCALAVYIKNKEQLTFSSEEITIGFMSLQLMLLVVFSVFNMVIHKVTGSPTALEALVGLLGALLVVFIVERFTWTLCLFVPLSFHYLLFSGKKLYFRYYMFTLSLACSFVLFL